MKPDKSDQNTMSERETELRLEIASVAMRGWCGLDDEERHHLIFEQAIDARVSSPDPQDR